MAGVLMPFLGIGGHNEITPNQIPNLNLWYDASVSNSAYIQNSGGTAPSNGQGVQKIIDKQGNGRDVDQSAGTKQALWEANQQNGLGTLLFDGANDFYSLGPPIAWALSLPGQTTYIVTKPSTLSGVPRLTTTNTNGFQFFWDTYWGVETAGGRAKSLTAGSTSSYVYMGQILDGTQTDANITVQNNKRLRFRINGVTQTLTFSANVGTATSGLANLLYLGTDGSGPASNYYHGYIGELLIWTRTLNSVEITSVENYLSDKWGI